MKKALHNAGLIWSRVAFLFTIWLRQLLNFICRPIPAPLASFATPLCEWHRLLGAKLVSTQRAYLIIAGLGLLAPLAARAQISVGLGLTVPTPVAVCLGQPVSLTLVPSGLLNLSNLANVTVTNNGTPVASALGSNGILTLTGTDLNLGANVLTVRVAAVSLAAVTANVTVTTLALPALAALPVALPTTLPVNGVVSLSNVCGTATPLLSGLTTISGLNVTLTNLPQTITVACRNGDGCTSAPVQLTIPAGVVPVVTPVLTLPTLVSCAGQDVNVQLGLTSGGVSILNQLNLANVTVRDAANTAINVSALSNTGVLTLSAANLASAQLPLTVTVSALNGLASVSAQLGLTVVPLPTVTLNTAGIAGATLNSSINLGNCPVGSVLSYTTAQGTGTGNLVFVQALSGQAITIACTGGACPGVPTTVTLPTLPVVVAPTLTIAAPAPVCIGSGVDLNLVVGGLSLPGATVTVTNNGNAVASTLGSNGLLSVSTAGFSVGDNTLVVTVSVGGVSVTANVIVTTLALPVVTLNTSLINAATLNSSINLGNCPVGSVLSYTTSQGTGTGNLVFVQALSGQAITIACTGGACPGVPTTVTLPTLPVVVAPTLTIAAPAPVCIGSGVDLNLVVGGLSLPGATVTVTNNGNAVASTLGSNGLLSVSTAGLSVGNNTLVVTVSVGGVTATANVIVTTLALPVVTLNTSLINAATLNSSINLGNCPVGSVLSYTTSQGTGTGNLVFVQALSGQAITIACTGGTCPGVPTTVTLPTLPVVVAPTLTIAAPAPVCIGSGVDLNLVVGGLSLPGATVTVTNNGNAVASTLGSNGLLSVSTAGLSVGNNTLVVTVSVGGVTATANVIVTTLALPVVTLNTSLINAATLNSSINLGNCPVGSVLSYTTSQGTGTGNLVFVQALSGQAITIACTGGTCPGVPTTVTLPTLPVVVAPTLTIAAPAPVCIGSGVDLNLVVGGLSLPGATVTVTNNGNAVASTLGNNGLLSVSTAGLSVGDNTLVVTVSVGGVSVTANVIVTTLALPVVSLNTAGIAGATLNSSINLGNCPVGSVLSYTTSQGTGTGNLVFVQALSNTTVTIACTGGTCPGTPVTVTLPTLPVVVAPTLTIAAPAPVCIGSGVDLNLVVGGLSLPGATVTVTNNGNAVASTLGSNGLLSVSTAGLSVGNNTLVVTVSVGGVTATANVIVTTLALPVVTLNTSLINAATLNSSINLGNCPVGSVLSYTTSQGTGTGNLVFVQALSGQAITIACTGGTCPGVPTTVTLPTLPVVVAPTLTIAAPAPVCIGSGVDLNLVVGGLSLPGATVTVTNNGNAVASTLGSNGLLSVSTAGLSVGNNTLVVTVSVGGVTATANVIVTTLALPVVTLNTSLINAATLNSSINLGNCPVGSVLSYTTSQGTGTGNLVFVQALSGQAITIACTGGTCPGVPTTVTLPTLPVVVAPTLTIAAPAPVCIGSGVDLNLVVGGLSLPGATVTVTNNGNAVASTLGNNGLLSVSTAGLSVGDNTLVVTVSVGGVTATANVIVTTLALPVVTLNTSLINAATLNSSINLGNCPVGSVLSYTTAQGTGTGTLVFVQALSGQAITIACTGGACPGVPTTVTLPTLPVVVAPTLTIAAPAPVCIGSGVDLNLVVGGLSLPGATVTVTNNGNAVASTLGSNGLLSVSTAGFSVGDNTLVVTVSVGGVSVTANVIVTTLALPVVSLNTAGIAGATLNSSINLGNCPVGSVLSYTTSQGTGTGNLVFVQALSNTTVTIACTGGTCPGTPVTVTLPTLPVVVAPTLTIAAPAPVCIGSGVDLNLVVGGLSLPGATVTVTNNGNAVASTLGSNGLLSVSTAGFSVGDNTLVVTVSVGGVSVTANVIVTTLALPVVTLNTSLINAATLNSSINLGNCPVGSVLSYTTAQGTGTGTLVFVQALSNTTVTIACTGGTCPGVPTTVTLPTLPVVVAPTLTIAAPAPVCIGSGVDLNLVVGGLSLPGATVTVTNNGNAVASTLGSNGLLSVSTAGLSVGDNTLVVTVSVGGVTATANVIVTTLALPVVTLNTSLINAATLNSSINLGSCPVGSVLSYTTSQGTGTGNLVFVQALSNTTVTIACTGGACPGVPTTVTLPTLPVVVAPTLTIAAPAPVCIGSGVDLNLVVGGLSLPGATVTVTNNGNAVASTLGSNGLLSVSTAGLSVGDNTLVVTVSVGGVTATANVIVTTLALPVVSLNTAGIAGATLNSSINLGSCPVGSVLSYTTAQGTGTGNLVFVQALSNTTVTIACTGGACPGVPTTVTLPTLPVVVAPTLGLTAPVSGICIGQPFSLTLLPINGLGLGQLNAANISVNGPNGNLAVSALDANGVLTISSTGLNVGLNSLTVTASVTGLPIINAQIGVTGVAQPTAPSQPQILTATVGNTVSLAGLCPVGALVDLNNLPITNLNVPVTAGVQNLTVLCLNGSCVSTPTIITIPPAVTTTTASLNILGPVASCLDQPISLTLVPSGGLLLSQLNLADITVRSPNGGNLTLTALGSNGVLALSSQGLSTGLNTLTLTVSVLNQPLVSATVNLNLIATPGAPSQPGLLAATVGNTVSLSGLCPVGVLVDASTLSPLNLNLPVTATVQNLTVVCFNNPCISLPTVLTVAAGVVTPVFNVSAAASICLGQPLSLTIVPANFGINDGVVNLSISGPLNTNIGAINSQGVATITNLPAGNQNLTISATVLGQPVVSTTLPINVISLQAPVVVSASGQSYPAGQTSLSVAQNTGNVVFTASCAMGTPTYTGSNGATGTGDITASTSATGVFTYSVVCAQGGCVSPAAMVSLTINPAPVVNQAPVLVNGGIPSPQSATVGVGFTLATGQYFTDPNGDPLTFTQTGLPTSLSISPAGVISGTPTVVATYTVTVTATDPGGLSVPSTFTLNVVPAPVVNVPPVLVNGGIPSPQSATVGVGFTLATGQYFTDPNGDPLTFTQTGLPASLSISPSGVISGTPTVVATYTVTVTATDPGGLSVPSTFTLNVVPAPVVTPMIPVFGLLPLTPTVCIGNPLSVTVTGLGALSSLVDITLTGGVATLTRNGDVLTLSNLVSGPQTLTLTASLLGAAPVSVPLNLTVLAPATPVIATAQTLVQGVGSVALTAIGCAPGETLLFSNGTGRIDISTPGVTTLTVSCQSQNGLCVGASVPVSVTVVPAPVINQAPVLVNGGIPSPQSATVGVGFTLATGQYFTDPNGDPLTFTQTGLPTSLSISPSGVISGTPTTVATYTVTVTATDPGGLSVPSTFTLNVVPAPVVNVPPVLVNGGIPSPQSATVGVGFTLATGQYFTDPNGDPLTFTQTGLPASLSISPSGVISGTPTTVATYTVTVTATDPGGLSVPSTFTLIVKPAPVVNVPPVLVNGGIPSPQSATVGVGFTLATGQYFTDPNGDPLTFTQTGLPSSLSISPSGVISGTPTTVATYTVTVTATDPGGLSVPSTFTLNVVPAPVINQAPVLVNGGIPSPQSATVGVGFTLATGQYFTDPNGDPLTFTQTGLPSSLSISPSGVISGTPTTVATYTVTVTATDPGGLSVPSTFTLIVKPAPVVNVPPVLVNGGIPSPQSATVGVGFTLATGQYFTDPNGDPLTFTQTGLPASLSISPSGVISGTPTVVATYTVTVTATDPGGLSVPSTFTLNVVPAPVVTPVIPVFGLLPLTPTVCIGNPLSVTVTGLGALSSLVDITLTGGVATLTRNGDVLTLSNLVSGPQTLTLTASLLGAAPVSVPLNLTVLAPATPVIATAQTLVQGVGSVALTAIGCAPGETLLFSNGTGRIDISTPGVTTLTVSCQSQNGLCVGASVPVSVTVVPAPVINQAPVLVNGGIPSPQSATVGVGFTLATGQYFTDPNGDPLTFTQTGLPTSLSISPSGVISGTPTTVATYTVTVTATDPGGLSVPSTFTLNVVPAPVINQAPVLVNGGIPSPQSATVGVGFTLATGQYFTDPNGDPLTFTQTGLPSSLSISPSGVISGTPTTVATYTVTVTATDPGGLSVPSTFTLNVVPAPVINQAPVLVNGGIPSPQSATVGVGFTLATGQYFTDPNGDPLTFTQTGLPASLSISPAGVISGTPTTVATYTVTVTATDPGGLSVPSTFTLNVVPAPVVNVPPVLVSGGIPSPQSATVGVGFTLATGQYFTDPNGDPLSFTQTGLPTSLSISPSGVISGTPTTVATYTVTVTATDPGGLSVPSTFTLNVVPAPVINQAPVLVNGGIPSPQSATVGVGFTLATGQYFTDPNGDPLTFTQTGLPSSLSISPSGVISGTPTTVATYTVTVTATDPGGLSVPSTFTLIVKPAPVVNVPPVLVNGGIPSPQSATVGVGFTLATGQYFTDPNGDPLTFTQTGLPSSLSISPSGVISGTPTTVATYTVTVTATDPGGLSVPSTFTLNVVPAPVINQAPVLVNGGIPSPQSATVGVGFTLATGQYFTDPNGDPLTFTQTGLPSSLSISPSGVISGTPTTVATYTVTVTATDPGGLSVPSTFTLIVKPAPVVNVPPVLVNGGIPSPQSATVGVGFTLATGQYFTDPNGDPLTFTQTGLPASLSISPSGVISGTPTVVATYTVTVTATDPGGLSVPSTFTLNVVPAPIINQAPVLVNGGIPSPQSATVGVGFTLATGQYFTDPNGDPLTFTQTGLPTSLSISPSGVISGTPTTVATYTVTVTATDPGGLSVPSTFTLVVKPASIVIVTPQPPMLTQTPIPSPQSATVGVGYSTTTAAAFSNPSGETLTYGAGPLPTGVSINPITGVISGTPTMSGTFTVVVTATTPQNMSMSTGYQLIVSPAPVVVPTGPLGVTVVSYNCATGAIVFGRLGGDPNRPVEFQAVGVRDWSTNPNGIIDAPVRADANNSTITVTARYVGDPASAVSFTFNFRQFCQGTPVVGNQPPVVVPPGLMSPQSATVGVPFSTSTAYAFTDPEKGPLTFTSLGLPPGLTINPLTGVISGTPTTVGTYTVTVTAIDNGGASVSTPFTLIVNPATTAPGGNGGGPVDLAIPKVDVSRRTPAPGERLRYVTNLRNEGGPTGTNVVIQVQMPAGFVYTTDNSPTTDLSSSAWAGTPTSAGTTYDPATNQVIIRVPSIGPGEDLALFFYGLVPTTRGKHYAYWQILSTDQSDPDSTPGNGFCNGEDDTQSIDTRVLIPTNTGADISLDNILMSKTSPAQNDDVTFTVPVRNNYGPLVSTNVLTKLTLPAGLSFVAAQTTGVTYNAATREVAYNAATIAINAVVPFSFSARVLAPTGSTVKLQAEIKSADQFDHNSEFGNVLCNNYDDDQAKLTFTVSGTGSGTVTTPGSLTGTPGGPLVMLAPLYNCQTGDITFRTTGGNATPIYFSSVGVVANSTNPNQNISAAIRNDANSKPITINATQSGVTVSYTFDFRSFCSGNPGTPPAGGINHAPVMSSIPNYTVVVGVPATFNLPPFTDPDGDVLTYSGAGFPVGFSLTFSNGQLKLSGTAPKEGIYQVFVTGTDPGGLSDSRGFLLTVLPVGANTPTPAPTGPLALIAPQFNCETGDITFLTTGGDGTAIEFMAAGVKVWSTSPTGRLDRAVLTDPSAHIITLLARQNGVVVTYNFDFRYFCWGSRQGATDPAGELSLKIMENPTSNDFVEVEVQGAEGKPLQLRMIDMMGRIWSEKRIEMSLLIEHHQLPMGTSAGTYILQAVTPVGTKTVKVLKR